MADITEQRVFIRIWVKPVLEIFQMLKEAYRNDALSRARVFDWHRIITAYVFQE